MSRKWPAGRGRRRPVIVVIALLVALTIAVRVPDALSESLWLDEVSSARAIAAPSPLTALGSIRRESSPPAWFFLGRIVYPATSMEAVRLLSVLSAAVLTGLVVVYARRLVPLWAAGLAGLLVALGYQLVVHGKELRAYALLALLSVALPLLLELVVRSPSRRLLAALALLVALGSLTHYFFLFVLLACLLWLWASRPAGWARVTAAIGVGLAPLLAWLPVLLYQAGRVNRYFPPFEPRRVFNLYSNLFASGKVWADAGVLARAGVVALVLVGVAVLARRVEGRLCALLAVLPVALAAFVWLLGLRIFDTRNLIIVAPFAAIAIAAAVAAVPFRPLAFAAALVLAAASVWAFSVDRKHGRTPFDEVAGALAQMGWTERDPIVHFGNDFEEAQLAWHLPGHPRLVGARAGAAPCRAVYVVVDSRRGHRWLRTRLRQAVANARFPAYRGYVEGGRKSQDVVAARFSWSAALLRQAAGAGAFFYHARDASRPPCLAPGEA